MLASLYLTFPAHTEIRQRNINKIKNTHINNVPKYHTAMTMQSSIFSLISDYIFLLGLRTNRYKNIEFAEYHTTACEYAIVQWSTFSLTIFSLPGPRTNTQAEKFLEYHTIIYVYSPDHPFINLFSDNVFLSGYIICDFPPDRPFVNLFSDYVFLSGVWTNWGGAYRLASKHVDSRF